MLRTSLCKCEAVKTLEVAGAKMYNSHVFQTVGYTYLGQTKILAHCHRCPVALRRGRLPAQEATRARRHVQSDPRSSGGGGSLLRRADQYSWQEAPRNGEGDAGGYTGRDASRPGAVVRDAQL